MTTAFPSRRGEALLLFAALLVFFAVGLDVRDFMAPTEARYIEIPRQMLATGDWLTPRINGVPYFEKPPLFYWMQAVALSLFGLNEFAGRIVTALLSTGTCLLTAAAGHLLFGRRAGLIAAAVLASSILGYGMSGVAALDAPVTFFITACLLAFLLGLRTGNTRWYYAMYAASALAVMTKGLIGMVIPGLVIGVWIAITGRWALLKDVRLPTGLLLFLAIAAPWHIAAANLHPAFFDFYFIHEHVARFLTDQHHRTAPWWFFISVALGGLLPWTLFLPAAARNAARGDDRTFLLLWIILPLLFFSLSHSKLISYIFPIFPPMAVLIGHYLAQQWDAPATRMLRHCATAIIVLYSLVLLGLPLLPMLPGKPAIAFAMLKNLQPAMLLPMGLTLVVAAAALARASQARTVIMVLAVVGAMLGITSNAVIARIDQSGVKPLAQKIRATLGADDMVVAYKNYWQDLPVYLDRNITIAGWKGELKFGYMQYDGAKTILISEEEFWTQCTASPRNVYVFMLERELDGFSMPANCRLIPIGSHGKTLLLKKVGRP